MSGLVVMRIEVQAVIQASSRGTNQTTQEFKDIFLEEMTSQFICRRIIISGYPDKQEEEGASGKMNTIGDEPGVSQHRT